MFYKKWIVFWFQNERKTHSFHFSHSDNLTFRQPQWAEVPTNAALKTKNESVCSFELQTADAQPAKAPAAPEAAPGAKAAAPPAKANKAAPPVAPKAAAAPRKARRSASALRAVWAEGCALGANAAAELKLVIKNRVEPKC